MPQNVRNFWIELSVDGKQTRVATGPRGKDGGFELTIRQRDKGDIITGMMIRGYADLDKLVIEATTDTGTPNLLSITRR